VAALVWLINSVAASSSFRTRRPVSEARITVVDHYSPPAAREELVALASSRGWEAVLPETNTGFGGGMNLGVARARELGADLLVLLNPDAVIARADLIRLAGLAYPWRPRPARPPAIPASTCQPNG